MFVGDLWLDIYCRVPCSAGKDMPFSEHFLFMPGVLMQKNVGMIRVL
jgi:hypothetical protein